MGSHRYYSEVESAGEVLGRWLGKRKAETRLQLYILRNRWAELVGDRIAAKTLPQTLRDGLLTVAVANSTWLNELSFMRGSLVQRINAYLAGGVTKRVSGIRLVAGSVTKPSPPPWAADRPEAPPDYVDLPPDQVARIEQELQQIEEVRDPELRGSILRARLAHFGRVLRFGEAGPPPRSPDQERDHAVNPRPTDPSKDPDDC